LLAPTEPVPPRSRVFMSASLFTRWPHTGPSTHAPSRSPRPTTQAVLRAKHSARTNHAVACLDARNAMCRGCSRRTRITPRGCSFESDAAGAYSRSGMSRGVRGLWGNEPLQGLSGRFMSAFRRPVSSRPAPRPPGV